MLPMVHTRVVKSCQSPNTQKYTYDEMTKYVVGIRRVDESVMVHKTFLPSPSLANAKEVWLGSTPKEGNFFSILKHKLKNEEGNSSFAECMRTQRGI